MYIHPNVCVDLFQLLTVSLYTVISPATILTAGTKFSCHYVTSVEHLYIVNLACPKKVIANFSRFGASGVALPG
ncbi:hypothetical protein DFH06DRAFT_1336608 [Mycena polygramma]|nr:hypothetical protein DFH06DRAFT_1336608 [Mycena polygramma]